jgi:hypothetical protein
MFVVSLGDQLLNYSIEDEFISMSHRDTNYLDEVICLDFDAR